MDEDSLYQTLLDECLLALACLKDAGAFLPLAGSNPSVYLGAASAKEVPEAELEDAILESLCEVRGCQAPVGEPGMDKWAKVMGMDGLIAETARLHALVRRFGDIHQDGPNRRIQILYWLVMGERYPYLPRDWSGDANERR